MIHAKSIKLMIMWHLMLYVKSRFVLKSFGIERCCAPWYVSG